MKCTICSGEAQFVVAGTAIAYCEEHAKEFFADTSYLASVADEAKRLKDLLDEQ